MNMHAEGTVAEAIGRLKAANLIPPIGAVEAVGPEHDESVLVTVRGLVSSDLRARVAETLGGMSYELREVSPTHGIVYQGGDEPPPRNS